MQLFIHMQNFKNNKIFLLRVVVQKFKNYNSPNSLLADIVYFGRVYYEKFLYSCK